MAEAKEKLKEVNIQDYTIARLDDFLVLFSKTSNGEVCTLTEDEESQVRSNFDFVTPWHTEYGLKFCRMFEILGIPLHLWDESNIRRIPGNLGEVNQVHFKKDELSRVEVCIAMDLSNPRHQFHNSLIVKDLTRSYNIIIKEVITSPKEESEEPIFLSTEKETPLSSDSEMRAN